MKLRGHPILWVGLGGAGTFVLLRYLQARSQPMVPAASGVSTQMYMGPITVSPSGTQGFGALGAIPAGSFRGQLGTAVNLQGIPPGLPLWGNTTPYFQMNQPTAQTRYSPNLVHRLRGGRTLTHRR